MLHQRDYNPNPRTMHIGIIPKIMDKKIILNMDTLYSLRVQLILSISITKSVKWIGLYEHNTKHVIVVLRKPIGYAQYKSMIDQAQHNFMTQLARMIDKYIKYINFLYIFTIL